jgi:hypothetical protein
MYHMLMQMSTAMPTPNVDLSEDYHKINQDSASAQNHVSTRTWFLRRVYTRRATSEKDEDSGDGQGQEEDWGGSL